MKINKIVYTTYKLHVRELSKSNDIFFNFQVKFKFRLLGISLLKDCMVVFKRLQLKRSIK